MARKDSETQGRWGRGRDDSNPRHDIRGEGFDRRGGWRGGSDYYGAYSSGPKWYSRHDRYVRSGIRADETEATSHRGRGPKGYRRPDERILEDVCKRLTDDERIDASDIEVCVEDCVVTLSGSVNSRDEKRRTEDIIAGLHGVSDVRNELRVAQATGWQSRS